MHKVMRGGVWGSISATPQMAWRSKSTPAFTIPRMATRNRRAPAFARYYLGFRVIRRRK